MKATNLKTSYFYNVLVLSIVLTVLAFSGKALADNEEPIRLNFGVYSSNKPTTMVRTFKPTLKALEASMSQKLNRSVDIRMQIAKDYDQGVADLINGKVDFSRFGPASYIQAKSENDGLELLAMENKNDEKVFYGIIAVHNDSDIKDIKSLKNRSFAFGDESSTIGRFLSQHFLFNHGIHSKDLSKFKYLGRHDKVGTAVGAGDYDAGALNESTFKKLIAAGEPIKELARFPNVTKPWIARNGLAPEVLQALQQSLYELKDPKTLKSLKADGFLPGTDLEYETVRLAMEGNQQFFDDPVDSPDMANSSTAATVTNKAIPLGIQINIIFDDPEDAKNMAESLKQPLVINVTVPSSSKDKKDVIVTTSRDSLQ